MAHYFITGHTGFKGAWLILLLKSQGHQVSGLGLNPVPGAIFERINQDQDLVHDFRLDIRDRELTIKAIRAVQPDYVIHLAAQALVRDGYRNPIYTYETNVFGTLNVLEAVDRTPSVQAHLIVTTDKVYLNQGFNRSYKETDPLGGKDPYSASKAMADILAQEFLSRGSSKPGIIARAGNVIGLGDVSRDRLMPEIQTALRTKSELVIRNPKHVRPWQHVLDCLDGYLRALHSCSSQFRGKAINFGPLNEQICSVQDVVELMTTNYPQLRVRIEAVRSDWAEDEYLALDSTLARNELNWAPVTHLNDSLLSCVTSENIYRSDKLLRSTIVKQIRERQFESAT